MYADLDPDPAAQINADPDPKPWFSFGLRETSQDSPKDIPVQKYTNFDFPVAVYRVFVKFV